MKRNIVCLLLALALTLTGCGENGSTKELTPTNEENAASEAVDETAAEEQALLLADTLLFIHGMESGESIWNDFLCGIVKEEMSPNYFYDLKKIWLISLSDICDRT